MEGEAFWSNDIACSEDNAMAELMRSDRTEPATIGASKPITTSFSSGNNGHARDRREHPVSADRIYDFGNAKPDDLDPFSNSCSAHNVLNRQMKQGTHVFRQGEPRSDWKPPKPSPEGKQCSAVCAPLQLLYSVVCRAHCFPCTQSAIAAPSGRTTR
jgi:hypothetical protein